MSTNKIKIELSWKIQELSKNDNQRNGLMAEINAIEQRKNFATILEKNMHENRLDDLNQSLKKIEEKIIELSAIIENLERQLENTSTNSYSSEENCGYAKQHQSENSTQQNKDLIETNDLDTHINEKVSSIPINLGDFGNVHSNYYQSRLEELRKFERVIETNSSYKNDVSRKIQASDLVRTDDPIKKTILYVATFFSQLSDQDFERIVSFSLQWQSIIFPLTEENEKPDPAKANFEKKNLSELWKEESISKSDKLMEECYLSSVSLENHTRVIEFDFQYLRDDLKTHFKGRGSQYLEKQFKRSKLLLLDPSIGVAGNAIELSIDMAQSNPPVHGGQWLSDILNLFRLFTNFLQLEKVGFSSSEIAEFLFSDDERWEEFKLFAKFLSQVPEEYRGEFLISRIAFLIQRMLEISILKPEVENFLNLEIATENQETVLALISLLQSESKFDWLPWAEKLLNEKSKLIGFYTRQIFFLQLEESKSNIFKFFTRIKHWIPHEKLKSQSDYTQSQVYALRLIYKYSRELSDNLETSEYGCYPPKYQLFASLGDNFDDKSTEIKLKLLTEWAFDSNHEHFVKDLLSSASLLIAEWFCIICGLNKEIDSRSLALADKLLEQVITEVNPSQQRELIQHWNRQRNILLTEANKAQKDGRKSLQNNLIQNRESVRQLIERFIYIQQSNKK